MTDTTTTNAPAAYVATVLYRDQSDTIQTVTALVLACGEADAIRAAVETVDALPECKRVEGGMIEPFDLDAAGAGIVAAATLH